MQDELILNVCNESKSLQCIAAAPNAEPCHAAASMHPIAGRCNLCPSGKVSIGMMMALVVVPSGPLAKLPYNAPGRNFIFYNYVNIDENACYLMQRYI